MKKLISTIFLIVSIKTFSANPPPPGLPDEPVTLPIDSMIYVLFAAGLLLGGYVIFKRNKI